MLQSQYRCLLENGANALKRTLLQWGTAASRKRATLYFMLQPRAARCSMLHLQYRCFPENGVNALKRTLLQWFTAAFRKRATLYSMLQPRAACCSTLQHAAVTVPLLSVKWQQCCHCTYGSSAAYRRRRGTCTAAETQHAAAC